MLARTSSSTSRTACAIPCRNRRNCWIAPTQIAPPATADQILAGGWWLNRHQLLKASYEWLRIEHLSGTQTNVLGFEFVTTFHAVDQAFH